jgi:predicted RNase H-like nuclease (RuvC/YqgF family)
MIVGVDPGTTVGWACVSLRGKVIGVGSKRNLDPDGLLANIVHMGRALIVGCDKAKTPFLAQSIAAKFGAKVVSPNYDLLVDEKRELTKDFETGNAHELDALASALYAYNKVLPLLRRVEKTLEKENKMRFFEKVVEIVLKENMSIRAALVLCDDKPIQVEEPKSEEEERDVDLVRLFSALSRERRSFIQVKELNSRLENEVKRLRNEVNVLRERQSELVKPKSRERRLNEKDARIQSFADRFENIKRDLDEAKSHILFLERQILKKDLVAIPKMSKLSWNEAVSVKPFVDDCVFIENVDSLSDNAVKVLSDSGVRIVLCKKLPSDKLRRDLPFIFREFQGTLAGNIALVNNGFLEKIRKEKDALLKVIEEFKKERSKV